MIIQNVPLLDDLITQVELHKAWVEIQNTSMLSYRPDNEGWTAAECLNHLNFYGEYYIPAIRVAINSSNKAVIHKYTPGILGTYFAIAMKPDTHGKVSLKMKCMKDYDPRLHPAPVEEIIETFINQQIELLRLLHLARTVDLGGITVPISITKLIRLKLGDTLRFVIYHNERHILQAKKIITQYK